MALLHSLSHLDDCGVTESHFVQSPVSGQSGFPISFPFPPLSLFCCRYWGHFSCDLVHVELPSGWCQSLQC